MAAFMLATGRRRFPQLGGPEEPPHYHGGLTNLCRDAQTGLPAARLLRGGVEAVIWERGVKPH